MSPACRKQLPTRLCGLEHASFPADPVSPSPSQVVQVSPQGKWQVDSQGPRGQGGQEDISWLGEKRREISSKADSGGQGAGRGLADRPGGAG